MTRSRGALGFALWLLLAHAAPAAEPPHLLPPGAEGEILAAEAKRGQALVDADVAALKELFGEELRFTHANGTVESKYVLLAALEAGRLDYSASRTQEVTVRVYGDAGVVAGTAVLQVRAGGGALQKLRNVFTAVYVKRDGAWRLVAYQSTRAPEVGSASPPSSP